MQRVKPETQILHHTCAQASEVALAWQQRVLPESSSLIILNHTCTQAYERALSSLQIRNL